MYDDIYSPRRLVDDFGIANISPDYLNLVPAVRIIEVRDIQGYYPMALRKKESCNIDSQKTRATGYQVFGYQFPFLD